MNNLKVVIDAGHGGTDSGAVSGNVLEKDLTLMISRYMYNVFRDKGVDVTLIRSDDESVSPAVVLIAEKAHTSYAFHACVDVPVWKNDHGVNVASAASTVAGAKLTPINNVATKATVVTPVTTFLKIFLIFNSSSKKFFSLLENV